QAVRAVMAAGLPRAAYYPGAAERMQSFVAHSDDATLFDRGEAPACVVVPYQDDGQAWYRSQEIFAPAFSTYEIEGRDAQTYLQAAIDYANTQLHGTLGANILIHPTTIKEMGEQRFQALVADLKYGTVAINTWTGLGFLTTACPWGAFPGHTLADVRSGIGFVHNTFMFDKAERVVVQAPWRPFPRNVLSGVFDLLPKPPWYVTNKTQHITARLMTGFQHKPSWWKLPRIFLNALLG
ncbi:aldehyde dehydrogenase, partial [Burkholderiaceae bacterium]|nr:aldehyde dehydrogenase [Burkholderiaceae bacterium]